MQLPYTSHCKACGKPTRGYVFCGPCQHAFNKWLLKTDLKLRSYERASIFNFTIRKETHNNGIRTQKTYRSDVSLPI